MIRRIILVFVLGCVVISGFTGLTMAATDSILGTPFGTGGLSRGMTKSAVISKYGEPDIRSMVTSGEWKEPREEWFYKARYEVLPVNAGYFSEDLYLYFDGDNLTNVSKTSLGQQQQ